MPDIVYDAGALIAAERGRRAFMAMHREALAAGIDPTVPDVVLAQVWRGGPGQALLSRVLAGCIVAATGERTARAAGVACGRARTSDIVDAVVVVTAIRLAAPVVTGDRADLRVLADALGAPLVVLAPTGTVSTRRRTHRHSHGSSASSSDWPARPSPTADGGCPRDG